MADEFTRLADELYATQLTKAAAAFAKAAKSAENRRTFRVARERAEEFLRSARLFTGEMVANIGASKPNEPDYQVRLRNYRTLEAALEKLQRLAGGTKQQQPKTTSNAKSKTLHTAATEPSKVQSPSVFDAPFVDRGGEHHQFDNRRHLVDVGAN